MIKQIEKVLDVMKADYRKRSIRSADAIIMTKMGAEYDDGLEIKEGIRYYKIICNNDH